MVTATALLPELLLILAGCALARLAHWRGEFWVGLERITYYVFFPALLFQANAKARLDLDAAGPLVVTILAAIAAGVALGVLAKFLFRPPQRVFGAGFQCAFRLNSYVGLALAGRIAGEEGLALAAVVLGITVPILNTVSVIGLAHGRGTSIARELATNPLIVSTVAGVAWGMLGLPLPEIARDVLGRLGAASIVLGLLTVGAALDPTPPREHRAFIGYILAVKLFALPAVAWAVGAWLSLPPIVLTLAVGYSALPTASASYILAVRLGADGHVAAKLVSYSVAGSLLTLPLWLAATQ
jgi:predicted permease